MIAHRIEWLTENDKIIANADPIEIPAVAAFSLALICSPRLRLGWILQAKANSPYMRYGKYHKFELQSRHCGTN